MYDIAPAHGIAPAEFWAALAAQRALDDALEALENARAELSRLAAETTWQSRGVAALHERLVAAGEDAADAAGTVRGMQWSLGAAVGP
ncbi:MULTISPECIES: hypothetical protein [Microbacterium]|uniref:hypothetical protein n=1 Tax=Microbacterium TaxID=33882 RepID=UPI00217D0AD7|nr:MULTISPECIES: hypothetical protein [Microbacterium]UWF77484.1 hypothetical protein JSY13_12160 [Microbacterium neungamense]WCM55647.1 hypothetical protein JRG78_12170 [Microbacterium sp. EF45047]